MNYSCISDVGYFDSPNFISLVLHINTGISTPIHFFGLYCILFKTPEQMKSVKWYIVNLHCWIVLFDYSFSILTIPFLLLPEFAGYPLGILRYFGVPTVFQTLIVLVIFGNMAVSIVAVFENRFHVICTFDWKSRWTWWRRVWLASYYFICCILFIPFAFLVPDQDIARQNIFKRLPCLPHYIYETPIFVLTEDYTYHLAMLVIFIFTACFKALFFIFGLVWNTIKQLKNKKMSKKTFQLQRNFFIAVFIQMEVPLVMFIFPLIYAWVSILKNYYNQKYTNIACTLASMHGFISTLVMLVVHRPYRKTVLDLFAKRATQLEETSVKWRRYQRNIIVPANS